MNHDALSRRRFLAASAAAVAGTAASTVAASANESTPAALAFSEAGKEYRFDTGALRGTLRQGGRSLGLLPAVDVASGTSLAGSVGLFSPYRLLTPQARFGPAAYGWPSRSLRLADGVVEVNWTPDDVHPLAMTAVYRFAATNILDFLATVTPQKDLRRFELFLASYFQGFPAAFAYAQEPASTGARPAFLEATKAAGDWQMFPRDDEAARIIVDGRWTYPPNPVDWTIRPRYAAPLAVRRDPQRGLTAVVMSTPQDCFAVSMPQGDDNHRSLYLSLFGRDIKANEVATARARLVIGRDISDARAVELYEAYHNPRTTLR